MGCTNKAETDIIAEARTKGDADRAVPAGASGAARVADAVQLAHEIDRRGDAAMLKARSGEAKPTPKDRAAYGDVAEAAAARHIVEVMGHELIHQNTRRGEKGIDLVTYDANTDSLVVWEFKSSLAESSLDKSPQMGSTKKSGRQMSGSWIDARLDAAGLDAAPSHGRGRACDQGGSSFRQGSDLGCRSAERCQDEQRRTAGLRRSAGPAGLSVANRSAPRSRRPADDQPWHIRALRSGMPRIVRGATPPSAERIARFEERYEVRLPASYRVVVEQFGDVESVDLHYRLLGLSDDQTRRPTMSGALAELRASLIDFPAELLPVELLPDNQVACLQLTGSDDPPVVLSMPSASMSLRCRPPRGSRSSAATGWPMIKVTQPCSGEYAALSLRACSIDS
jgi:hypothetical protein